MLTRKVLKARRFKHDRDYYEEEITAAGWVVIVVIGVVIVGALVG